MTTTQTAGTTSISDLFGQTLLDLGQVGTDALRKVAGLPTSFDDQMQKYFAAQEQMALSHSKPTVEEKTGFVLPDYVVPASISVGATVLLLVLVKLMVR